MKILLIPDKFKGALAANEVISAIANGVKGAMPNAEIHSILASDGGEGFLNAILQNVSCNTVRLETQDPLGRRIISEYLFNEIESVAYIELAKASGLELLAEEERNVMQTSTFGTGLLIVDAIKKGATKIYLGIGGSATNDAGIGIAEALGFYFLDKEGLQLPPNGSSLSKINSIHKKSNSVLLKGISFFAINDVDNPLFGDNGAAYTYAKQKGASSEEIEKLDRGMRNFAAIVKKQTKKDFANLEGAGAAGGTSYGLHVFCDADFIAGIDFVLQIAKVAEFLSKNEVDYIITGEGKFDNQTLHGKLIKGVVDLGIQHNVPVITFCGHLDIEENVLENFGLEAVIEIRDPKKPLEYNLVNANTFLEYHVNIFFKNLLNK